MTLSSSNLALISYYDATNEDLKLAVCNDPACTAPTIVIVDGAGNVGRYTALVLDGNSFPVISYQDVTTQVAMLARRSYQFKSYTLPPYMGHSM